MRSFRMQEWNWNGLTMWDVKVTETACGASAVSGQEGERLNVWQESDISEDFSGRIM